MMSVVGPVNAGLAIQHLSELCQLRDQATADITAAVAECRRQGWSWESLAEVLGVRQASTVRRRYPDIA